MILKKILKGLKVKLAAPLESVQIKSVTADSRDVKPDSLFVAIKGLKFDGNKFVEEAFKRGAAAAVVEKGKAPFLREKRIIGLPDTRLALSIAARNFYGSPSDKLKVIGITGTNGKTTTSLLTESIFRKAGIKCGLIGTIEYRTGENFIPASRTTPGPIELFTLLASMVKNKIRALVMEVSSHALDQKRTDGIYFDTAVFTNLTHEHLDYHGDVARYFASKAKIFENLKKKGTAVINADDEFASHIKKIVKRRILTYGLAKQADISAEVKKAGLWGSSFAVKINGKRAFSVDTHLAGPHNISNILAAVSSGVSAGIDFRHIKEGIESVTRIKGRLERVMAGQPFSVFVDYAHTHNALQNVLDFLKSIKKGRVIIVFGCGGERDRAKRPLMGCVAQRSSNFVIITNDNPRSEDPTRIVRGIEGGMDRTRGSYAVIMDRKQAIKKALKMARNEDIVLIAGKGHETEQVIGETKIAFDDRKVTEEILKKDLRDS